MSYAQMAHDKRNDAIGSLQKFLDDVAAEGRAMTAEETERVEKMEQDAAYWAGETDRAQRAMSLGKAADALRGDLAPRIEAARDERRDATDGEMLRKLFTGEARSFTSFADPQFRALQSAGGSAIPTTFYDTVTVYLRDLTPMLDSGLFTVLNTPTGESITLPRLTADPSLGGTVTAEAGGITEADPTLSTVTLDSYKFAAITLWSAELGIDNVIGLEGLVAQSIARELAVDIGALLTTGDGTNKPNGIVTAAGNGGTATGTAGNTSLDTFFGPIDLIDLTYSVASGYRQRGAFMAATTAVQKMRKFRDANKQFLYTPSLSVGMPDTFNGHPVVENPAMAAVASASKSVIFGDMSRYFIRRCPSRTDVSMEYKYSTDQLAIRHIERIDSDLVDTAAIKYLVSANV